MVYHLLLIVFTTVFVHLHNCPSKCNLYSETILMKSVLCFPIDSSMYAHFLFEAFDTNKNGSVSFEVSAVQSLL